jgi:hypothetical protein
LSFEINLHLWEEEEKQENQRVKRNTNAPDVREILGRRVGKVP